MPELIHNLYNHSHPETVKGCRLPTSMDQSTQNNVWKVFQTAVEKQINFGFDDQFVNAEVFVFPNGSIKIMEVNPRMFGGSLKISDGVFNHGSQIEASIQVNNYLLYDGVL